MMEMPQLVKDICHILYFKHLTRLCSVATECVSSLAVDHMLQMMLLQAGVLWHLLLFMFSYDFTLEEGGVERSEEANQQVSPFVCQIRYFAKYSTLCFLKILHVQV
jgi:DnaJ family protein C protein 13